jgi:formylglycine-generating enzyme required for sulfatase activity
MNQPNGHIFISYAREDRATVVVLAGLLATEGWEVWWDRDSLPAGQQFHRVIDQAIRDAGCVLVCWSGAAIDSDWVLDEANEAKKQGKLLPILLEDVRPPYGFRSYHYVDLSLWDAQENHEAYRRLSQELKNRPLTETVTRQSSTGQAAPLVPTNSPAEIQKLVDRLRSQTIKPEARLEASDALAEIGDPRPGVGLNDDGIPDIDWVEIPGGKFLYGGPRETRQIETFDIARYPVTNLQYQAFIDDRGYQEELWWEDLSDRKSTPRNTVWPQSNRPRTFVNWYECIAFCRWISNKLGYDVLLPTEAQWERAARGTEGRDYPWGNEYRTGFANVDEPEKSLGLHRLNQTSGVGLYDMGASPEGVLDMAGNVGEWILNEYANPEIISQEGDARRALRGGAWNRAPDYARTSLRLGFLPYHRHGNLGFRVVRELSR